jgi:hypothetical protein
MVLQIRNLVTAQPAHYRPQKAAHARPLFGLHENRWNPQFPLSTALTVLKPPGSSRKFLSVPTVNFVEKICRNKQAQATRCPRLLVCPDTITGLLMFNEDSVNIP